MQTPSTTTSAPKPDEARKPRSNGTKFGAVRRGAAWMGSFLRPETPRIRNWQLVVVAVWMFLYLPSLLGVLTPSSIKTEPVSAAISQLHAGAVQTADVNEEGTLLQLHYLIGSPVTVKVTNAGDRALLSDQLKKAHVVTGRKPLDTPGVQFGLFDGLRVLWDVAILFWFLAMARKYAGGGSLALGGGGTKDTSNEAETEVPKVTFADVIGCNEVVEDLSEALLALTKPEQFAEAGARMPRGILLVGPPGTGKTLVAKALAGEAGAAFFQLSGSDFTSSTFAGVGTRKVGALFKKARAAGKAVIFIDELDTVGRRRGNASAESGVLADQESTLNKLLTELDGFSSRDEAGAVLVIGATNRPETLDPALRRAGRFDRTVTVGLPDSKGRFELLTYFAKGRLATDEHAPNLTSLARRTTGMAGADLEAMTNEASLRAAKAGRKVLTSMDYEQALQQAAMGRARTSAVVTELDARVTAWHEAGHAIVAMSLASAADPVQISITPRGMAGGVTWMEGPEHQFYTRKQATAQLAVAMGGRAGEELALDGDVTQGASDDLRVATEVATAMVCEWGMTELGLSRRDKGVEDAEVRVEVERLLAEALETARETLRARAAWLAAAAAELLAKQDLTGEELRTIGEAHPIKPARKPRARKAA